MHSERWALGVLYAKSWAHNATTVETGWHLELRQGKKGNADKCGG